jgi:mono/diheme cytochrome c family protein
MTLFKQKSFILISVTLSILVTGCFRGMPSDKTPVKIVKDMDNQPRYNPQSESPFFEDGATMRPAVPGTVASGQLREDDALFRGLDSSGNFVKESPIPVTPQLLLRGQERFNIYCSPCHSRVGDGKGIVAQRGFTPPPTFHSDRIRQFPAGQFFDVITHGVRTMPSYGGQIRPEDRWAIISYVRALQRSQNATLNDVPEELRRQIR